MRVSIEHGIAGAKQAVSRQDSIVIIDTIRASTTYVNAFASGVEKIVPCASRVDLSEKIKDYPGALRSGERLCRKIEGYELGSSPEEMSKANLAGKIILSSTTNGSKMVLASFGSPLVVIGSFCNLSAVIDFLSSRSKNISLVCSGRLGEEVPEDTICAELFEHKFLHHEIPFRLNKEQIIAQCLESPSYAVLASAGLENDFYYCMDFDSHTLVPVLSGDGFTVARF